MFIRAKKIKRAEYAYQVRNEWTSQGPRQKVNKYLGRLVRIQRVQELPAPQLAVTLAESLRNIVAWELQQHGFVTEGSTHRLNSVICNTEQHSCFLGGKLVVLALNNGYLCNDTLHELLNFIPVTADIPEEANGRKLAFSLIKAGIALSEDVFVQLVDIAVKELRN